MGAWGQGKGGPHGVPHQWGPPLIRLVPARLSKGNSDKTFPATRPGPGSSRWRPDKGKQKTPRSSPRAGFESFSGFSLGRHLSSPRASSHAFPAWPAGLAWRIASMASRAPRWRPGDPEMDRDSCPAHSPARAYLSTVRENVVTEIGLLRFSAALTCRFGQGSPKSAFRPKTHPIAIRWTPSATRSTSKATSRNFRITSMLVFVWAESGPVENEPPRASAIGISN